MHRHDSPLLHVEMSQDLNALLVPGHPVTLRDLRQRIPNLNVRDPDNIREPTIRTATERPAHDGCALNAVKGRHFVGRTGVSIGARDKLVHREDASGPDKKSEAGRACSLHRNRRCGQPCRGRYRCWLFSCAAKRELLLGVISGPLMWRCSGHT